MCETANRSLRSLAANASPGYQKLSGRMHVYLKHGKFVNSWSPPLEKRGFTLLAL